MTEINNNLDYKSPLQSTILVSACVGGILQLLQVFGILDKAFAIDQATSAITNAVIASINLGLFVYIAVRRFKKDQYPISMNPEVANIQSASPDSNDI